MSDEKGTDDVECSRIDVNSRKVASTIKSSLKAKGLSRECTWVLQERILQPVLKYIGELSYGIIGIELRCNLFRWSFSGVLDVRIDKMRNECIRRFVQCEETLNRRINGFEGVLSLRHVP